MKIIKLNLGQFTLVDDEDFDKVCQINWFATYDKTRDRYDVSGRVNGKNVLMHRFIMEAVNPKIQVDHRNHNSLDNQRDNLRLCTNAENQRNQRKQRRKASSRFKGVCYFKRAGKWIAYITLNRKRTYLGYYFSEETAAAAYNKAAFEYFGEFALLNIIDDDFSTKGLLSSVAS